MRLNIEDEPVLQELYKEKCQTLDINCIQLYDGDTAFDFVHDSLRSVDCIILDFMLPGHSGQMVLEAIRRQPNHPLVLVVSAIADHTDSLEDLHSGEVRLIEKGEIPLGKILEVVQQYFLGLGA